MTTCSNCGTQAALGQSFCGRCGAPLVQAQAQAQAPAHTRQDRPPAVPDQLNQPDQGRPAAPAGQSPPGYQPGYQQDYQQGYQQGYPAGGESSPAQPVHPPYPGYGQTGYQHDGYGPDGGAQTAQPPPPGSGLAAKLGITWRSGQVLADRPLELWLVIGLLGYAAALFAYYGLKTLVDTADVFSYSSQYGLIFVLTGITLLVIGVAIGLVARMVYQGDPAGRLLALFTAGILLWQLIYQASRGTHLDFKTVLLLLALIGWTAGLLLLPAVLDFFRSSSWSGAVPTVVAVAQALTYLLGFLFGVAALASAIAGGSDGKQFVYAVLEAVVCAACFIYVRQLPSNFMQARLALTAASAAALLIALIQDGAAGDKALTLGLAAAVPIALWLPYLAAGTQRPSSAGEWPQGARG